MKIKKPARSKTPNHTKRKTLKQLEASGAKDYSYHKDTMGDQEKSDENIVCRMVTKCEHCIWPPSMNGEKDLDLANSRLAKVKSFNLVWQLWFLD